MKTKVDILIVGNLLCTNEIRGGIYHCPLRLLEENFDTRESLIDDLSPIATEEDDKVKIIAAIDNALNRI